MLLVSSVSFDMLERKALKSTPVRKLVQAIGTSTNESLVLCRHRGPFQISPIVQRESSRRRGQTEAPACLLDEPLAHETAEVHVSVSNAEHASSLIERNQSALGLSHALGHKLGATYSIPHGITSVSTVIRTVSKIKSLTSHVASVHHIGSSSELEGKHCFKGRSAIPCSGLISPTPPFNRFCVRRHIPASIADL